MAPRQTPQARNSSPMALSASRLLWTALPFAGIGTVGLYLLPAVRLLWVVLLVFSVGAIGTAGAGWLTRESAARAERSRNRRS
jgi:hypothetical protein